MYACVRGRVGMCTPSLKRHFIRSVWGGTGGGRWHTCVPVTFLVYGGVGTPGGGAGVVQGVFLDSRRSEEFKARGSIQTDCVAQRQEERRPGPPQRACVTLSVPLRFSLLFFCCCFPRMCASHSPGAEDCPLPVPPPLETPPSIYLSAKNFGSFNLIFFTVQRKHKLWTQILFL
ncbi:unnamed protein product [Arctogadus glacialis]